jgi:hypothetical protein
MGVQLDSMVVRLVQQLTLPLLTKQCTNSNAAQCAQLVVLLH